MVAVAVAVVVAVGVAVGVAVVGGVAVIHEEPRPAASSIELAQEETMETHRDRDFEAGQGFTDQQLKELEALKQKAFEMSAKLENVITAGAPGERMLLETTVNGVLIRQMPDDPLHILRVSLGESTRLPDCTYLVFRGDPSQILLLLRRAVRAMEQWWKQSSWRCNEEHPSANKPDTVRC